ncbi:MAG: ATP-binding protein [Nitrososphaera sp.]|nr:ATP-binding protein [Nitrososphaera sp.]
MSLKIGNVTIQPAASLSTSRLALLLWGASGSGKTTLSCTAPGKKLLVNLDPDGPTSIKYRGDVDVLDLSGLPTDEVLTQLKSEANPLGLDALLKQNLYQSIILDSATSLAQRGLESAIRQGIGKSPRFAPTLEFPGLSAYGGRNAIVLTCIKGLLRVTGRNSVHCIIIAHEDDPTTNDEGIVQYFSIMLGGKLVNAFSVQLGEIWWLRQDDKTNEQNVAIRACRMRKPMKTRMFRTDGEPEFKLSYDPEDWKSPKSNPLALWWAQFESGKGQKLNLPGEASRPVPAKPTPKLRSA